jgi:hypothetical protein
MGGAAFMRASVEISSVKAEKLEFNMYNMN